MSSYSRADRISIAIPIFFIALMIGSLIGIIGNSLLLNSSVSGFDSDFSSASQSKEFRIFKIVVASILTVVFLLMTIFTLIEVFEPEKYKARIITPKLDTWLQKTYENLESWELLLIISNYILIPVGIASSLIQGGPEYFVISAISLVIVYFSYNQRVGTRKAIRAVLPTHKEINIRDLGKLISKDPKYVRKAVIHLVSFENYPATYDYSSEIVTYNGPSSAGISLNDRVIESEVKTSVPISQSKSTSQPTSAKPCPYCGEMPVVPQAAFCSDCGASLVAAK